MPVRLSYFKDLNIDYVLAGHFHSNFDVHSLESGGYFVYPGSPVSITKRETGRRNINIFEVGKPPEQFQLDTPHFEEVVIEFDPFEDVNPIEVVRTRFDSLQAEATAILTVKGFVNGAAIGVSETDLVRQIEQITADRCVDKRWDCEFKDIGLILEDDLFKSFICKLEQTDCEEEKKRQMRHMSIQAMMQARS
jgi:exonuclease SbcD